MATKSGILATINGFITAVITQAKHRSSMSTVVDEIYPNIVTDTHLTETYTTKIGADIEYNIEIIKSGNIAHIKGNITNTTGSFLPILSGIFSWKNTEYRMLTGQSSRFLATNPLTSATVSLTLDRTLGLTASSSMSTGTFNFQFITYITQD
jgi:hypothetical protein